MTAYEKSIYRKGAQARAQNMPKLPPSEISSAMRCWWFCGWNERDQELTQ